MLRGKEKRGALSYLKLLIAVLKEQEKELDRMIDEYASRIRALKSRQERR